MIADEGLDTFAGGSEDRSVAAREAAVTATIASDAVDRDHLAAFAVLRIGFDAGSTLFRCGWFIESTATRVAVMLVLRTSGRFWLSKPGCAPFMTSIAVAAITHGLPSSPHAGVLGPTAVSLGMRAALAGVAVGFFRVNELVKARTGFAA